MPAPNCSLRKVRPTPTTVSFTVSTRTPRESIGSRVLHQAILLFRLCVVSQILLLLWLKWDTSFASTTYISIPPWLINSPPARANTLLITAIPGHYLIPFAFLSLLLLVKRGYTGKAFRCSQTRPHLHDTIVLCVSPYVLTMVNKLTLIL